MLAIQQKIDAKETEKRRLRAASKDEEEQLSQTLAKFSADLSDLKGLTIQIDRYTESNQADEFGSISTEISTIESRIHDKEEDLRMAEPNLDSLTRQMNDQERHKKNLSANIAILKSERRISEIEKEVGRLKNDLQDRQGSDTAEINLERAEKRKLELTKDIAGYEGQRREILEQIRSLKVRDNDIRWNHAICTRLTFV
jgi:DNA repair protein RAD50